MIYSISYQDNGAYFTFNFADGSTVYLPKSTVIFVDDESGCIAVKNIASRKTMFLIKKQE